MRPRKLLKGVKGMLMSHGSSSRSAATGGRRRFGTRFALPRAAIATWITFAALTAPLPCAAAGLALEVLDKDGHGVEQVVVTASPTGGGRAAAPRPAVMDQKDRAFVPGVLVVAVGTSVEFPNNDSVSHQVYSFSPAKRFQLPLYKGQAHPPVTFDQPGLVVLGCNIHDSMVGYIYVTDAAHFGITDARGTLTLDDLPRGDYQIVIWSPYIADAPAALARTVHIEADGGAPQRFQLAQPLRSRPEPKPRRRDWDY
jgi:plastocyanin